jgi:predicted transcriptional regulator
MSTSTSSVAGSTRTASFQRWIIGKRSRFFTQLSYCFNIKENGVVSLSRVVGNTGPYEVEELDETLNQNYKKN